MNINDIEKMMGLHGEALVKVAAEVAKEDDRTPAQIIQELMEKEWEADLMLGIALWMAKHGERGISLSDQSTDDAISDITRIVLALLLDSENANQALLRAAAQHEMEQLHALISSVVYMFISVMNIQTNPKEVTNG